MSDSTLASSKSWGEYSCEFKTLQSPMKLEVGLYFHFATHQLYNQWAMASFGKASKRTLDLLNGMVGRS